MKNQSGLVEVVLIEGPPRIHDILAYCETETTAWTDQFPGIVALWKTDYREELERKFEQLVQCKAVVFATVIPEVASQMAQFFDSIGFTVELRPERK